MTDEKFNRKPCQSIFRIERKNAVLEIRVLFNVKKEMEIPGDLLSDRKSSSFVTSNYFFY